MGEPYGVHADPALLSCAGWRLWSVCHGLWDGEWHLGSNKKYLYFCKRAPPFHSASPLLLQTDKQEIMCTLFGHVILLHWNIIVSCWTGLYSRWSGACSSHCDRQWKQLSIRDFSEARSENYWSQHQVTRLIFCPNIYMKSVLLSFQVYFFFNYL